MISLASVTALPCVAILISALIMRRGVWTWMSLALTVLSLSIAMMYLRQGVAQSCQIDESECLGATATFYLVVTLWSAFVIVFLVRLVAVHRSMR